MAIAYLGYRVDSGQVAKAEKRLDRMSGAAGGADKRAGNLSSTAKRLAVQLGAVAAAAAAARGAFRASQQYQQITNLFRGMGQSASEAAATLQSVADVANRTRAPLEATAQLYQRVSIAGRDLGASSQDVLRFTENVGLALASAGVGAGEARGALLQLSQAMAGGVVRAEEFNSILEGAFPIAQAAANGIDAAGGSVGRLRNLVIEGKVSSEEFFNSILSQTQQLEESFEQVPPTIGQAFSVLGNNLTTAIGQMDAALGISSSLAEGIIYLSDNLGILSDGFKALAVITAGLAATQIPAVIAAMGAYIASVTTATTLTGAFTTAISLARAAIIKLGGPLGIVYGLLGSVAAGLILFKDESEGAAKGAKAFEESQIALNAALGTFSDTAAPSAAAEAINLANTMAQEAKQAMEAAKAQIALAEARQAALASSIDTAHTQGLRQQADEQAAEARERLTAAENALAEAERARDRTAREVTGGPMALPTINVDGGAGDRIDGLSGSVDGLMARMGGEGGAVPTPDLSAFEALRERLQTEREMIEEWREETVEATNLAREQEVISQQEHNQYMLDIERLYQEQLNAMRRKKRDEDLGHYQSFFGQMASALQAGGSKMLKISKAFALAEAAVSIWRGAAKALELPFPANLSAWATVLATGAKAIAGIKGTSSGSAGGSLSGGSSGGAAAASASTQPREPQRSVRIEVQGEGMFADMLRDNVDQIADAIIGNTKQGGAPIVVGR